jgi:hypothetical protein
MKKLLLLGLLALFPSFVQAQTVFTVSPQTAVLPSSGSPVTVTLTCNWNPCYLFDGNPEISEWANYPGCDQDRTGNCFPTGDFAYYTQSGSGPVPPCALRFGQNLAIGSQQNCLLQVVYVGPPIVYTTQSATFYLCAATSQFGGCQQHVNIVMTVNPIPPTSITISPANPTVSVGGTQQLTATAFWASTGHTQDVTNISTWFSDNTTVATIDSNGVASGLTVGTSSVFATYLGLRDGVTLTVTGVVGTTSLEGKWVLFETASSPTAGGRCFNQVSPTRCFYALLDWNLTTNSTSGFISAPSNPYNPGTSLGLDNSVCGPGTPYFYGSISDGVVHIGMNDGTSGSIYSFNGNVQRNQPLTGWNLDGSQAPFSGFANQILGSNSGSSGCASQDNGIGFQAWQYPSLGNAQLSLNIISQLGTLNLPITIDFNLIEHDTPGDPYRFLVGGSGSITGPSCGPLNFTITAGEAIGNMYAMDGTYTNSAGGTGTMSLGLSMVTPFVVSRDALNQQGYIASADGVPLQVWSIDFSASSDGCTPADPAIGSGVAYPSQAKKHDQKGFGKDKHPTHKFSWERVLGEKNEK